MSVSLSIIGKHSIPFREKEIDNIHSVLALLNALKLEDSAFLKEMCITWNTSFKYEKSEASKREKIELERCLQIRDWKIEFEEDYEDDYTDSIQYTFEGLYGLTIEMNKYYIEIDIWIGRYYFWFKQKEDINREWREKWRLIICNITTVLGGDYVMYFPDNLLELSAYLPSNHYFPQGMSEILGADINNLDQAVDAISEIYAKPITLTQADELFERDTRAPFVVDKFDDLDKTLEI